MKDSLRDFVERRVWERAVRVLYTFLDADGEQEERSLSFAELDTRARAIAARLQRLGLHGERALLLFPPGLDFIEAFFGCLYEGVAAVPAYPPRSKRGLPRLLPLLRDARPAAVLTTSDLLSKLESSTSQVPELRGVHWIATDAVSGAEGWRPPELSPDTVAFLQYTSGSTSAPKGVIVSHGNLLHNEEMIRQAFGQSEESVVVGWLPLYHDMGLIGNVLQPLYTGARCVLMSPMAFLQRPARWLEAITRYRATTSGGPNFAYELCARKVTAEERERLDLGSWRVAFSGAEPVRAETLERFAERFGPCGFRREAFYPCYGLAEATLFVSGGTAGSGARVREVSAAALEQHRVAGPEPGGAVRGLVGCGGPWLGQEVAIVDPGSRRRCAPDRIGEIWVAGPSVAQGYWGKPEATESVFRARLADEPGAGPFLRTGDLGFFRDGELFVTGRLKDLVILRGRNHYPQDLELTAERAHPALRPGNGAAFSVEVDEEERLVVAWELESHARASIEEVTAAVRQAIAEEHEVRVHEVVLLRAGTLPKTTSGKVRRHACRTGYLEGSLVLLGRSGVEPASGDLPEASGPDLDGGDLAAWLRREVARIAKVPASRIDPGEPLTRLGLDSLAAVELQQLVESRFGVPVSVAELLDGLDLAGLTERIGEEARSGPQLSPSGEETGDFPLSYGQRALWFLHRLAPQSGAYHIAAAARVLSDLDTAALRRSLQALTRRHPALRTTFHAVSGEPLQRVHAALEPEFLEVEAAGWSETELRQRLADEAYRPFDLESGPLLRVAVFRTASSPFLLLTIHHAVADLGTLEVLARELGASYPETGSLPRLAVTYADYARWQAERLAGAEGERLWAYWRDRLAAPPPVLELPADRPRPVVQEYAGAGFGLRLGRELAATVEAFAAVHGATPFMVTLAAFQALLGRYTHQDDVAVGAPTLGRGRAELAGLAGYFVNPVVLRSDLSGAPDFAELLGRVRRTALAAFEHQDFPFPLLVERLQPERDPGRSPLFQVAFALQKGQLPEERNLAAFAVGEEGVRLDIGGLGNLVLESWSVEERFAPFDLTVRMARVEDGLTAFFQYAAGLFDGATVRRLAGHFQTLLGGALAAPDTRLSELPLLSEAERRQLLAEWSDTAGAAAAGLPVHRLVEAQGGRTPETVAVVRGDEHVTYRELERRAGDLARFLRGLGVGPDVLVGLCMERSPEMVVGALAALWAGGAYIPLDPAHPDERLAFMLEDARPAVLLTQSSLARRLAWYPEPLVALDGRETRAAGGAPAAPSFPEHRAYVIYTSGSTGVPKGVEVPHGALGNLIAWHLARFGIGPQTRSTLLSGLSFDAAVWDLWPPLAAGGAVELPPEEVRGAPEALRDWLVERQVTISFVPTAVAEPLLGLEWPRETPLRVLLTGGEKLRFAPPAGLPFEVVNDYGPTENTVVTTSGRVEPGAGGGRAPSLGRPLPNVQTYLLGPFLEPVPAGVAGELYAAGRSLARGYLGRPELTAERFVPDPFGVPGSRLYRTGDLARWLPDGEIEFLGRIDDQVKVRGFRIELGEVEAVLARHPGVREAAVATRGAGLVAFVVAGESRPAPRELSAYLRGKLPEFMVPGAYVLLPELPLTPNGKLDRRELARRAETSTDSGETAPRTPAEEIVAGIWEDLLGLERVGAEADFFALGGHSLLATRLVSRVRESFGVELPVRAVFESPTVAALAGRIEQALGAEAHAELPPVGQAPRGVPPPLSFAQERLWFLDQLQPGSPVYNIAAALRLSGALSERALAGALAGAARRHEALRTSFESVQGEPRQRIEQVTLALASVDLGGLDPEVLQAEALKLAAREAGRPFDLGRAPLARAVLLRLEEHEHVLLLTLHHAVSDGWSMGVLARELEELYAAALEERAPLLQELPVQYADYAVWQRGWLAGPLLQAELAWWRERLAGMPPELELPADRPRPVVQSHAGGSRSLRLPPGVGPALGELSRSAGATPFMVLLASFAALLGRVTGQDDLAVGTPIANRRRTELEGLIGFFANTLVLRADLTGGPSFRELLGRVRETTLSAYAHQDLPFERLVEELQPQRALSRTPLFQVMFLLRDAAATALRLPGVAARPLEVERRTAKLDLTLELSEREDGWWAELEHSRDLFDPSTADRLLGHWARLLDGLLARPAMPAGEVPLLSAAERRQLLEEWNETAAPGRGERCLHELFEEQADRAPDAIALVAGGVTLSYGGLERRANRLAWRLRSLGVGPEARVGILLERSAEMVAALLAVLKAGGCYVPLDPAYPPQRLEYLVRDAAVEVLVTRGSLDRPVAGESGGRPAPLAGPANLAYVIYTSGSTGEPKGVAIAHRSPVELVEWAAGVFSAEELAGVLASTSICFDLSVFELFVPLGLGGRVVLAENALALPALAGEGVTLLNTVPSAAAVLAGGELPATLRTVNLAGEALKPALIERLYAHPQVERVLNLYGPSEDTTYSTWTRVERETRVTIGRPVANTRAYVLDRRLEPAPVGVAAELCLGGAGLARGYLGRPAMTAGRFVPDPFGAPGSRLYRTGDLARWLPGGEIEFLGRLDHQVKVRGFRVELGEVESALARHPGVREAAVVVRADSLVAFVAAHGEARPAPPELAVWLRERLPEFMVPGAYVVLPELPLTPNGKVDRKALSLLAESAAPEGTDGAPRTPAEELLAGIWADLLGLERVGTQADFFALGGHSLLATRLVSRVREAFGVELPVRAVFEAPTVAALAGRVERMLGDGTRLVLPPIERVPRDSPEQPLPLSFAQERLWFLHQLEPGSAAYNIPAAVRLTGPLDVPALAAALGGVVFRHEALRTRFDTAAGQPAQRIEPAAPFALPVIDLRGLPDPARAAELRRLAAEEALRPFDLGRVPFAPWLRAAVAACGDGEHVALLTLHHIAGDGWSIDVLTRELGLLYSGLVPPALTVQYADYAVWQRRWLSGEVLEREVAWWRERLAGAPELLPLPTDRPRPAVLEGRGASVALALSEEVSSGVERLARGLGATPFMVTLAAFAALLWRYTGQPEIVLGTPVAGRNRSEIEGLIGLFVNTLVLRVGLAEDPGLAALVRGVRETSLDAWLHQDLPFEKLVEELAPRRSLGHSPLFQVMFLHQNAPWGALELPGLRLEPLAAEQAATKFDLTLTAVRGGDGYTVSLAYNLQLFEAATAGRMLRHFAILLTGALATPEVSVSGLPLLREAERRHLLAGWTAAAPAAAATVPELFLRRVEESPDAVALVFEDHLVTYGVLAERATRLAARLRDLGVGPESTAGICLERSPAALEALLGVLLAGGAYVPLDPELPAERRAFMLEDSGARVLIDGEALTPFPPFSRLPQREHLAYVIYTSGSTGLPKGVGVEHRHLAAYVEAVRERMALPAGASFATVSTLAADLGHTAVFPALCSGGALHVISRPRLSDAEAMADYFERHAVDVLKIVPSHLAALMAGERPERVLPRRLLVLGGEASSWSLVERVRALAPGCRVLNHYGPTETTVGVLTFPTWEPGERAGATVPLGRPLGGTRTAVVDPYLEPVPPGVPGELLVGGPQVTRGYLGRPGLTAERFVPDPFAGLPGDAGSRLYRTGDLVRRLPAGELEFLGRIDQQVKVRGFRVELGEVEAALRGHPEVREAAVVARPGEAGPRLAAFVVGEIDPAQLRGWLRERLPEAMVPSEWALLDVLPLTANGKVDRRALAALEMETPPEPASAVPLRTPAEEMVAAVWCDLLGVDRVGGDSDFFDLGGHSLLATRLVSRLRQLFDVELPVRAVFETPTVAGLAAAVETGRRAILPPIEPVPRDRPLPLSFAQQRLWLLDQMMPGSPAYNIPEVVRLEGDLDEERLAAALDGIVRRHEVLRTTFSLAEERPVQVVSPARPLPLPVVDLRGLPEAEREVEARRLARREARRPFDLARGPVVRATLLALADRDRLMLLTLHHIASDAWSAGVLVRELGALYAGRPLPELPVHYADFAVWQRRWLTGEVLEEEVTWWRGRLAGAPVLELPADRPRPPVRSGRGANRVLALPRVYPAVEVLARAQGATPFMVLMAAFQALLGRSTGQTDLTVGTPVAGRNRAEVEGLIGFFINTLVLRADLDGDPPFLELLRRVRGAALEAYAHQELPFERLVEELAPARSLAHTPLFQVMLILQNAPFEPLDLPGVKMVPVHPEAGASKFDLTLVLQPRDGRLEGVLEYDRDLFDVATMDRLLAHFEHLLAAAVREPAARLSALPLLGEAERHELLVEWNDTAAVLPADAPGVYELVGEQARRAPDAVAVVFEAEHLTFGELDRRSNQLARYLRRLGVGPEVRAGIFLERSPAMVIGLLGILKAGAAYVPLDPAFPAERLAFMAEDAGLAVLLTQRQLAGFLPVPGMRTLPLDDERETIGAERSAPLPPLADPDNLAYVIYTSGSTGRPKGVQIPHRALTNFLLSMARQPGLTREDVLVSVTTLSFDIAGLELFLPLVQGARCVLAGRETAADGALLARLLESSTATVMQATPATWRLLMEEEAWKGSPRLTALCGGEALPRDLAARLLDRAGAVWNVYGPTEATIWASLQEVDLDRFAAAVAPIGRPLENLRVHMLDLAGRTAPVGVAGELMIGGVGLARGYLGRPELTAERFVPDPFGSLADEPGGRLYRTGDLARLLPDGTIEYLSRIDHQVKIRGFRIELGEVESALLACPRVREAVVVAREDRPGDRRLVAYLVAAEEPAPAAEELRASLRERLPEYMVPGAFVVLEALPLTPNGKVDRRALPAPEWRAARSFAAPATPVEQTLAEVWSEALGLDQVGRNDNFFDLGGNSLLMVRLRNRLQERLGRNLSMLEMFSYPTVAAMAAHLDDAGTVTQGRAEPPAGSPAGSEIAIIGMAGRFPGAPDLEAFWRNLSVGVESISFFDDEELRSQVAPDLLQNPRYVRARGVLDGAEMFDADLFSYSPREAEAMDPQQRIFLECAWEALEDAGYRPGNALGRVGVFGGSALSTYMQNLASNPALLDTLGVQATIGNDKDYLCTRVSYKLDLQGPSLAIQTACSTSLVALHLAWRSLLAGECDAALVGGVTVRFPQRAGYLFQENGIMSPDGHCRAFDATARGTVSGQGVGIVVLKPLAAALADGDTVRAVVRGSAINNDGLLKAGFTAPRVEGQAQVIRAAQLAAGVEPDTVTYIEAHGTGTQVGDPIEAAALTQAFRAGTEARGFCALGSVKTNIGHLDAAAGIAGLIKTVLALEHGLLPPSLHFTAANPEIDFESSPFYVNSAPAEWRRGETPRRAGVSSFGIGGTNAHVVLEEAPPAGDSGPARPWQLLALSARTPAALERMTDRLAERLRSRPDFVLADAAYTLQAGRVAFPHRRVLVCREPGEAAGALEKRDAGRLLTAACGSGPRPVAFLLPGLGDHYAGMGEELYREEPVFRAEVDRCAELLRPVLGFDLREVLYPETSESAVDDAGGPPAGLDLRAMLRRGREGSADGRLRRTEVAQPLVFVFEYALARLWISFGVRPGALFGYSLGEYVVACLAGVLSLEDVLTLVAERARLIQSLPEGAMLAVPLPEPEVRRRLSTGLSLSAVNGPALCVVGGPAAVVADLEHRLAGEGVQCRPVQTTHAFHSAMMEPAAGDFLALLRSVELRPPRVPYLSNVTGTWIREDEATDPAYWVRHLIQTVRCGDALTELCRAPERVLLEVGPGRSLASLALQNQAGGSAAPPTAVASLRHEYERRSDEAFLCEALGRLWLAGVEVDWAGVHAGERRRRVPLPTYAFERQRFWVERRPVLPAPSAAAPETPERLADIAGWFHVPSWRLLPPLLSPAEQEPGGRWLVFLDDLGVGASLVERLAAAGCEAAAVLPGDSFARLGDRLYRLDPADDAGYEALLDSLGETPSRIVHLWGLTVAEPAEGAAQALGFHSLLALARRLGRRGAATAEICVVANGLYRVERGDAVHAEKATLLGPLKVIPQEYADLSCRLVEVDAREPAEETASRLLAELSGPAPAPVVARRGEHRWTPVFEPLPLPVATQGRSWLRAGGVYLVTGGLGGIGLALAGYLARAAAAKLVLVGRSPLPPRSEWERHLADGGDLARRLRALLDLEEAGSETLLVTADVADREQVRAAVGRARERFGRIDGVFHLAGVPGGGLIDLKTRDAAAAVLRPKVAGTQSLLAAFHGVPLDFMVLFSSLSSVLGGVGQVDYCAANAFLDACATAGGAGFPVVAIDWCEWRWDSWTGATALHPRIQAELKRAREAYGLDFEEGMEALGRILASGLRHVAVSTCDLRFLLEHRHSLAGLLRELDRWTGETSEAAAYPRPNLGNPYVAPRDEIERRLAELWRELLGIQQVGVYDNFFQLGGHSLVGLQVISRIRDAFGVELPLRTLFESPSVAELAEAVGRDGPLLPAPALPEIRGTSLLDESEILENLDALSSQEVEALLARMLLEEKGEVP